MVRIDRDKTKNRAEELDQRWHCASLIVCLQGPGKRGDITRRMGRVRKREESTRCPYTRGTNLILPLPNLRVLRATSPFPPGSHQLDSRINQNTRLRH
jgi:hypothetical protein